MNKNDIYVGKSLFCRCGKTYEVVSVIYEEDEEEFVDIKDNETREIKSISVDYLDEYINY